MAVERSTSTLTTLDYTTQGDPNQMAPTTSLDTFVSTTNNDQFIATNNFFVPDGSNRRIHDITNKIFYAGYLENGNNAYLLELPRLEKMLHTKKFLMDKMLGQFYTVWQQAWETGDLINQLAATRQSFGYNGLAGTSPR